MDFLFGSDLSPEAEEAGKKIGCVNEVLADRFAWERVRPGRRARSSTKNSTT